MKLKKIFGVAVVTLLSITQTWADLVPSVHRSIHQQMQERQIEMQRFQAMVDSLTSLEGAVPFELFPALDLYNDWDDLHVDPLRDKTKPASIPNSIDIDVSGFIAPIKGLITSPFGWRRRRMHKGCDVKIYRGDTIRAAFDGRVRIRKYERRGYGYYYVIRHSNGLETVYGHLSKHIVQQDEYVKAGQAIGLGGNTGRSTGPHLHFEFRFMGIAIDPSEVIDYDTFTPRKPLFHFERDQAQWAQNNKGRRGARYQPGRGQVAGQPAQKGRINQSRNADSGGGVHRVKKGDTLSAIAMRYGTSVSRLCKLNGINANKPLQIGQKIRYK